MTRNPACIPSCTASSLLSSHQVLSSAKFRSILQRKYLVLTYVYYLGTAVRVPFARESWADAGGMRGNHRALIGFGRKRNFGDRSRFGDAALEVSAEVGLSERILSPLYTLSSSSSPFRRCATSSTPCSGKRSREGSALPRQGRSTRLLPRAGLSQRTPSRRRRSSRSASIPSSNMSTMLSWCG